MGLLSPVGDKGLMLNPGTFAWALEKMRHENARVCRYGWNGRGMWIRLRAERPVGTLQPSGGQSVVRELAFVEMFTAQGELVPWLCSQTDMLAEDWEVA